MSNVVFLHNFAKDDTLVGKHLLLANLTYIQSLFNDEVFVHIRTKPHRHIVDMIENQFGFKLIDNQVFERTFDNYVYAGTGVNKVILPSGEHKPFNTLKRSLKQLKRVIKNSGTEFNRNSAKWYVRVLEYLSDKENVYNTIIDPVFDSSIKEFKHVYFCDHYKNHGIAINEDSSKFRNLYFINVYNAYGTYDLTTKENKTKLRNRVYANFNNVKRFNKKRKDALETSFEKGIYIGLSKDHLIYSINEYMQTLNKYRFTLVTYSYDQNTFSMLRLLDALALGVLPLIAVKHTDLVKFTGKEFADYVKNNGLNVLEKSFKFETVQGIGIKEHLIHRESLTKIICYGEI